MADYSKLFKFLPQAEQASKSAYNKSALEALKRARDEEAMLMAELAAQEAPEALTHSPFAGKLNDVKTIELPSSEFQLIGEPQSKDFVLGKAGEISRAPVPYSPKQLPSVLEKQLPAVIPEAAIKEAGEDALKINLGKIDVPNPELDRLNRLKAILAAGGAGAGLYTYMNSGSTPPPMAQVPTQVMATPEMQSVIKEQAAIEQLKNEPSDMEKALMKLRALASRPSSSEALPKDVLKDIDFGSGSSIASNDNLRKAQELGQSGVFDNQLARIGAAMASGMSGTKNNFDNIIADQIKDAQGLPGVYAQQVQMEKEDPNSPMSQGYKSIAKAMGFNVKGNASAADLERLFPQFANIYNQQEATKARALQAKENREARLAEMELRLAAAKEAKKEKVDMRSEELKNKFIQNAQKVTTKAFEDYKKVENAFDGIEQAQGDKMGAADVSILYNFIKSQDPASVVREGEIALGQRGMPLAGRLYTMTLGQFSGELLSPQFRKDVLKISRRLKDQGYTTYDQTVNTIRDTARQRYGFSEDELTLIDPMLNREKKSKDVKSDVLTSDNKQPVGKYSGLTPEQRKARIQELRAKKYEQY